MTRARPEHIEEWVKYLALDIGRRPAVRVDLLRKVADRLTEEFTSLGYEVSLQPVPYKKTHHLNVIARPKGSIDNPPGQPLLVIGAHYDTVSGSPGADDNASAVAGLIEMARLLADNKIVARFNGRMEFGPRALGNRSILYAATDPTVNDWLNKQLQRTEFMPFAPVTLREHAEKCYKNFKGAEYTASFMTITFDCTDDFKKMSPAVGLSWIWVFK